MAGKAPVFCGRALYYALNEVTKNQWIDFAVDQAKRDLGETASDTQIIHWMQNRLDTVWRYRKDRGANMAELYQSCLRASQSYLETHQPT